jgi:hypothetical protein
MFDDEFGQDFTEEPGSSGALDLAGFGDFATAEARIAVPAIPGADEMAIRDIDNSDPERLNELLQAIDHASLADLPVVHVPMDMITQFYQQF